METRTVQLTEANAELRRQIAVRTQVESELQAKAMELERSNRDLEEFAYFVSHDLQEPLRVVANYADLLGDRLAGRLDEDSATFLQYIADGAGRMKELVRVMLEYARLGAGMRSLDEVDPAACLDHALSNLGLALGDCPSEISTDLVPLVHADRTGRTRSCRTWSATPSSTVGSARRRSTCPAGGKPKSGFFACATTDPASSPPREPVSS